MTDVIAQDGLPARDSGSWGQTKLSFLDQYCPASLQATERKQHRYYVDLFAGPGVNVVRGTSGREYQGSPLRVLQYAGQQRSDLTFTHAIFINKDPRDHEALTQRVDRFVENGRSRIPRGNIQLIREDANRVVGWVMRGIPQLAYVLVFADMERPKQWPWESMQALKAQGHGSIDLYTLFPLEMAILRLMSYARRHANRYANALDRFFGTERWRSLVAQRVTDAQSSQLRRGLVGLYLDQLRTLWHDAGEMIDVRLRGHQGLYKMLFASDHPAAAAISGWIKRYNASAVQEELFS